MEESFFSAAVDEVCVEWERDGLDIGLYAGQRGDDVLISYSVDGKTGEVLQVEDLVEEMYKMLCLAPKCKYKKRCF